MSRRVRMGCWVVAIMAAVACGRESDVTVTARISTPPRLDPDYRAIVIPPNIAPLNFRILEPGQAYHVRISSDAGVTLTLRCTDGCCRMDAADWRELLGANRGRQLYYDVYVRTAPEHWTQYERFSNTVAREEIDAYIVFRQLAPNSQFTSIKGIFQRSLESFERSPLVTLRGGTFECVNCHTFYQHDPNRFLFHIRRKHSGTMLIMDGQIRKVNTRQDPMFRPLAFASWHPDGHHVVATLNMYVGNSPSTVQGYYFQAIERRGDLAVYDVDNNTISTTRAVFGQEYIETHPFCSPDGKYIYFARCRDRAILSHADFDAFRFDLMRIAYDADTDVWGVPETVIAYARKGKSCAFPCPSPDGRYLVHILADRGTYPIYQKSSDVCLVDLATGRYETPAQLNSAYAESYPRWSSNGRWLSFVSNRGDGRSALPYFAYFDTLGRAHRAFVLPQEDPTFYSHFTDTYNVLEMVKSRVDIDTFELARAMQLPATDVSFPAPPKVDAYTSATRRLIQRFSAAAADVVQDVPAPSLRTRASDGD